MSSLSPAEVERTLASAWDRPAGVELVFGALSEISGIEYDPGRDGGILRAAVPASLQVAEWVFSPVKHGNGLEVGHRVGGVVLSRSVLSPSEAAGALAPAIFEVARRQGSEASDQVESVLGALAEVLGL